MQFLWLIVFVLKEVYPLLAHDCDSDLNKVLLGGKYEFIDFSFPLDDWKYGFNREEISIENWPQHIEEGTFLSSPLYKDRQLYVTDLAPENLFVQLITIDVSRHVKNDAKFVLYMKDVNLSVDSNALRDIKSWPSLVVFKFGWSRYYYEDPIKYMGYDNKHGSYNLPAISMEVAEWLTNSEACKRVVGVGTDLPSVDARANNNTSVQDMLTKAGLYIIDGLNLNSTLPNYKCTAVASPIKIQEGSAPVNVIAICLKDKPKELANEESLVNHKQKKREAPEHETHEHCHCCENNGHEMGHKMEHEMEHETKDEMEQVMRHNMEHMRGCHKDNSEDDEHEKSELDKKENSDHKNNKTLNQGNQNEPDKQSNTNEGPQKVIGGFGKIRDKLKEKISTS